MADTVRGLRELACTCSICSSTVPGAAKRTTSTVAVWPIRCKRPIACCSKEGVGATSSSTAVWAAVSVRPAAPPHVRSGTSRTAGGAHVLKSESASWAFAPAPNNFCTRQKSAESSAAATSRSCRDHCEKTTTFPLLWRLSKSNSAVMRLLLQFWLYWSQWWGTCTDGARKGFGLVGQPETGHLPVLCTSGIKQSLQNSTCSSHVLQPQSIGVSGTSSHIAQRGKDCDAFPAPALSFTFVTVSVAA